MGRAIRSRRRSADFEGEGWIHKEFAVVGARMALLE